jgi:hypothetical protein
VIEHLILRFLDWIDTLPGWQRGFFYAPALILGSAAFIAVPLVIATVAGLVLRQLIG